MIPFNSNTTGVISGAGPASPPDPISKIQLNLSIITLTLINAHCVSIYHLKKSLKIETGQSKA
jgi:hypothetical protein